jgi:hypothetical protein
VYAACLLNLLALQLFDLLAWVRGYRFTTVKTAEEAADFMLINDQAGFAFPPEIAARLQVYKNGAERFIAYHRNRPAGIVRLADPKIVNRPFELYGVDPTGEHFEIQTLVVAPDFRDGSHFVMVGLFKAMYCYSIARRIPSWISCSTYGVYRTMRRYSREIRRVEVDFANSNHPVTRWLHANGVFDTCYTMPVSSFSPWQIMKRIVRFKAREFYRAPRLILTERL